MLLLPVTFRPFFFHSLLRRMKSSIVSSMTSTFARARALAWAMGIEEKKMLDMLILVFKEIVIDDNKISTRGKIFLRTVDSVVCL
jgi:hypothetical protein